MRKAFKSLEHKIFVVFLFGSRFVVAENICPVNAHFLHKTTELKAVDLLMIRQDNVAREKNEVGFFCRSVTCKHFKRLVDIVRRIHVHIGCDKNFERLVDYSAPCIALCDKG